MSNRTIALSDALYEYLLSVSLREPPLLKQLREETAQDPMARMQISPEQGQFMGLLVELTGACKCIEVGVFTGYSSLCIAKALPEDGQVVACDISEQWTQIARRYWQQADVEDKMDLRIAPATDTLHGLLEAGQAGTFDFGFIDADKSNYQSYFESVLRLLRPGGLMVVDNTLWSGSVIDSADQSEDTQAIRAFNQNLAEDDRVSISMLPVGDGLTLARKKSS